MSLGNKQHEHTGQEMRRNLWRHRNKFTVILVLKQVPLCLSNCKYIRKKKIQIGMSIGHWSMLKVMNRSNRTLDSFQLHKMFHITGNPLYSTFHYLTVCYLKQVFTVKSFLLFVHAFPTTKFSNHASHFPLVANQPNWPTVCFIKRTVPSSPL